MNDTNHLPDELLSTLEMVWCAFPDGIGKDDDYWPLIGVLQEHMEFRDIAKVISVADAKYDYWMVFNDAMGFIPTDVRDKSLLEAIREKLTPCGYGSWMRERGG